RRGGGRLRRGRPAWGEGRAPAGVRGRPGLEEPLALRGRWRDPRRAAVHALRRRTAGAPALVGGRGSRGAGRRPRRGVRSRARGPGRPGGLPGAHGGRARERRARDARDRRRRPVAVPPVGGFRSRTTAVGSSTDCPPPGGMWLDPTNGFGPCSSLFEGVIMRNRSARSRRSNASVLDRRAGWTTAALVLLTAIM